MPTDDPIIRSSVPTFGQVGRAPPGGGAWSRGLMLFAAIGVFAALVALLWDLQRRPKQYKVVEVSFMEEEAAAAEAALGQGEQAPEGEEPAGAP